MPWHEDNEGGRRGGCFNRPRRHRVRPFSPPDSSSSELVEIRPKRVLRIQHINARSRSAKFEHEMQMQLLYKSQGLQAGLVSAGPLTMPKTKPAGVGRASTANSQAQGSLPHSIDTSGGGGDAGIKQTREISASGSKAEFTSPSNVHVALQNMMFTQTGAAVPAAKTNSADTSKIKEENAEAKGISQPREKLEKEGTEGEKPLSGVSVDNTSSAVQTSTSYPVSKPNTSRLEKQTPESTPRHNGVVSSNAPTTLLFFIHGVGGSSDVWQAQIKHFSKFGYEIVAPDLIGHGLSATPKDKKSYHFKEIVADMEETFDKYCKKRNIVIGHSYGCSFAAVLARKRSRRVQKLVLISGGAPTPLAPQPGLFSMPTCMLFCMRPCLNCGFHKSAFHTARRPVLDKAEAFSIPTYVLQHTMNGQDWVDGDELYHQWLLCPTLLVYGAQDKLVSLQEEQHMEEVIFRSRLEVISDASHMVMIEAPDEVNQLLQRFMMEDSSLQTKANSPVPPPAPPTTAAAAAPSHANSEDRCVSRMSTKSYKAMPSHLL